MDDLYHLNQLAVRLNLPRPWLRREAAQGRIPCLRAGRRLLFSLTAVAAALSERAARERGSVRRPRAEPTAELTPLPHTPSDGPAK